jgi:membrane-associated phospholipid phosphatase
MKTVVGHLDMRAHCGQPGSEYEKLFTLGWARAERSSNEWTIVVVVLWVLKALLLDRTGMLMHAAECQQCATNFPSVHRRIATLHVGVLTLVFAWRVELQLPGLLVAEPHS